MKKNNLTSYGLSSLKLPLYETNFQIYNFLLIVIKLLMLDALNHIKGVAKFVDQNLIVRREGQNIHILYYTHVSENIYFTR